MRWLIVLMLTAPCVAQTTMPATRPADDAVTLRRIIAGLQRQIADLKVENDRMARQLRNPKVQAALAPPASKPGELAIGETLAEVRLFFGDPGRLIHKSAEGETYEWAVGGGSVGGFGGAPVAYSPPDRTVCHFQDGKLVSFSKG